MFLHFSSSSHVIHDNVDDCAYPELCVFVRVGQLRWSDVHLLPKLSEYFLLCHLFALLSKFYLASNYQCSKLLFLIA